MPAHPRARVVKIVVAGLPDSGKTTLVNTLSELSVIKTERFSEREGRNTTVAMDFGVITIDESRSVHLYGLPGQERFSFMMDVLNHGVDGLIYLSQAPQTDAARDRECFDRARKTFPVPLVVGVTKVDCVDDPRSAYSLVRSRLGLEPQHLVLTCDARDRDEAKTLLVALFNEMIAARYR